MKKIYAVILVILVACQPYEKKLIDYVNPFIGTGGHGHTYPGAASPFGMVQLSPDSRLEGWDGCGAYHYSDSVIYGFNFFFSSIICLHSIVCLDFVITTII